MNSYIIKLGLTILLFGILLTQADISEIKNIIFSIEFIYLILALLVVPILYIIRTYKWKILLNSIGMKKLLSNLIQVLLIGVFYGLITPGKIGEFARVYHLSEKKSETIPTVLMEKITDIFVLIILSSISVVIFYNNIQSFTRSMLIIIILFISGMWLLTRKKFILESTRLFRIDNNDSDIYINKLSSLVHDKNTLAKAAALSAVYYLIAYVLGYFLLLSLNIDTSMIIALPIIILMGNIPITISGLGLRESVSAICFILLGDSGINGVSFSILLFSIMILLPGIVGYFLTMRMKHYG